MTFQQWQSFAQSVNARADRITRMIHADARRTCKAAGLDPDLLGIHPHNAMCSFEYGRPWPEVNYSLCRRTLWLIERSYEPGRIASRIIDRAWRKHIESRLAGAKDAMNATPRTDYPMTAFGRCDYCGRLAAVKTYATYAPVIDVRVDDQTLCEECATMLRDDGYTLTTEVDR